MKIRYLLPFIFFNIFCFSSWAADGDVTTVIGHQDVDMTWYGNYDQVTNFPDGTTPSRRILMHYKMGCSSAQCSDWDYTTSIRAMHNTGMIDSTIVELDTISTNPLIVDTIWNVFDVLEAFELGRVITPYGGYMANNQNGFSNDWNHTHTFDVTDFAPILKNDVIIRAFFDGWSNGFSVSLEFEFIEGTPSRPVLDIQNYRRGSFSYNNSAAVEAGPLVDKDMMIPSNATSARMRVTTTGHGFTNNVNCAEFCQRYYNLKINNIGATGNVVVWNDDCAANSIKPQAGTWFYNRAGWCPGQRGTTNLHEITDFMTFGGASNNVNIDMQNYAWSGDQTPSYYMDAQLVSYDDYSNDNDVAITEVMRPNSADDYARRNPICDNPIIKIKNMGGQDITTVDFIFGMSGGALFGHTWNGTLAPSETTEVTLPNLDLVDINVDDPKFIVNAISVNDTDDQYIYDNLKEVSFEAPPLYNTSKIVVNLRTNNRPNDNAYTITDAAGNVVYEKAQGTLTASTTYNDEVILSPGCYIFHLTDVGSLGFPDGLSNWLSSNNGVTSGYIILRNDLNGTLINFNPDFGSEVYHEFVIGDSYAAVQTDATVTDNDNIINDNSIAVYPNPSSGIFNIEWNSNENNSTTNYIITDISGKTIIEKNNISNSLFQVDLNQYPKGIYFIRIQSNESIITKELVLTK